MPGSNLCPLCVGFFYFLSSLKTLFIREKTFLFYLVFSFLYLHTKCKQEFAEIISMVRLVVCVLRSLKTSFIFPFQESFHFGRIHIKQNEKKKIYKYLCINTTMKINGRDATILYTTIYWQIRTLRSSLFNIYLYLVAFLLLWI